MTTFGLVIMVAYLLSWAAIPHLLLLGKKPTATLSWALGLFLLPFPTLPLYVLIGTDRLQRQRRARLGSTTKSEPLNRSASGETKTTWREALENLAESNWEKMTNLQWFAHGKDFYDHLEASINAAQKTIYVQTYVWQNDERGKRMLECLCTAARRGVSVYLLADELGSWPTKEKFFAGLVKAGGHFSWFYTVHPRRNRYFINLRNHRKIIVIDHGQGYLGGMNFGLEYEGKDPATGDWIDLHAAFRGSVVDQLEEVFCHDWHFATQEHLEHVDMKEAQRGGAPAILIESGPDERHERNHLAINALLGAAQKRVDLFTPYFIPTNEILHQLKLTALRGVKVRLMICQKSDIQFLIDIGKSFYRELLIYGVKIFEYEAGVHHSKAMRVDDSIAMIGSTNLDIRSLYLNFEANLYFEDESTCRELDQHFTQLFTQASEVTLIDIDRQSRRERLRQGFLRLLAPLL